LKHVEQLRNIGIINSTTRSHLVGYFYTICVRKLRWLRHVRRELWKNKEKDSKNVSWLYPSSTYTLRNLGLLPSSDVVTQMDPLERAIFSHRAKHAALRSAYFNLGNILTTQMTIIFPKKCYTSFRYQSSRHNLLGNI